MSSAELPFGVLAARRPQARAERLRTVAVVERTLDALPVDAAVARASGRPAGAVVTAGRQPGTRAMDLLVAPAAAWLCTRDAADLVGLQDHLEVVVVGDTEGLPH